MLQSRFAQPLTWYHNVLRTISAYVTGKLIARKNYHRSSPSGSIGVRFLLTPIKNYLRELLLKATWQIFRRFQKA